MVTCPNGQRDVRCSWGQPPPTSTLDSRLLLSSRHHPRPPVRVYHKQTHNTAQNMSVHCPGSWAPWWTFMSAAVALLQGYRAEGAGGTLLPALRCWESKAQEGKSFPLIPSLGLRGRALRHEPSSAGRDAAGDPGPLAVAARKPLGSDPFLPEHLEPSLHPVSPWLTE